MLNIRNSFILMFCLFAMVGSAIAGTVSFSGTVPCGTSQNPLAVSIDNTYNLSMTECWGTLWATPDSGTHTMTATANGYYPYSAQYTAQVSQLMYDLDMTPIGASLTWDKSEYTKGETAHLTISFNSANFDNSKYLYQVLITNPVTSYSDVFTITSSTMTLSENLIDEGVWESTIWVSARSDINQGILNTHDYRTVSGASIISFISWQYHVSDLGALGSDGKFTYGVSSSTTDYIATYIIKMYKDGVLVNTWNDVSNFGTLYYPLTQAGTYEVKLIRSIAYVETVLKSDINKVNAPQSFIQASKTSYNTTESVVISGKKYPESTEKNFYYVIVSHYQSITSVNQRKEISYPPYSFNEQYTLPVGRYTASLYGYSVNCAVEGDSVCMREKDYVTFDVVEPMVGNQHALNISWVKKEEKLWTVAWVNYQNATSNDIVKIFDNAGKEFKNWRTATYPYTLGVQLPQEPSYIGNWSAKIYNASNLNDYKVSYLNVVSASQQNFTNDEGVVMNWDTPVGTPGMHELTWNTGNYSGSYYIKLVNGVTGVYLQQFPYSTGSTKAQHQSIYLDKKVKIYSAQFISGNSIILSSANIEISENAVSPGTTPLGNYPNGNNPMQEKTDDFMASGMMISFIIMGLFIGAGVMFGGPAGMAIGFVSGVSFCAYFEMLPMWMLFLVAIVTITAFASMMSKQVVGGSGD